MSKSQFVDFRAVKREVSMVQVLEHYGLMSQLHRNGDSITGACPIHGGTNKTAFRISISKNCWNCFSRCAGGGNVLDFVSKKENVSLLKAANLLVEWFKLRIESRSNDNHHSPPPEKSQSRVREKSKPKREPSKFDEADNASGENKPLEFALKNLQPEHPYLTERGLSAETVQTFGLGFCSKGLHTGRIAIPIHNIRGELVAYAGRWPGEPAEDTPKYKLPAGFKKSLELFNIHRALQQPAEQPLAIVEGFFDCLKLWEHGHKRVVALMGSTLSSVQEELIRKHTNSRTQILVMLDEDDAGRAGRDDIALRLSRFCFVKSHQFESAGMQPEHLAAEQVRQIIGGAL
jgi:DNA primase